MKHTRIPKPQTSESPTPPKPTQPRPRQTAPRTIDAPEYERTAHILARIMERRGTGMQVDELIMHAEHAGIHAHTARRVIEAGVRFVECDGWVRLK